MMTIQKPKRQFQKKKAYLKRKLLKRFEGGKDQMSYQDWLQKAIAYKEIDDLKGYDYEGWYNEDPKRAYAFLNDDPEAHFDDKYKTVYHPTFSDQSIYSGVVHPIFNPKGLKGGKWVNDHKYISPRISPVSMDERINYVNSAEDNGVQIRTYKDQPLWMDDGTRYDGVLPQVVIKPKHNCGKDKFNSGTDDIIVDDGRHNSYIEDPSLPPVLTNDPNAVAVRPNVFVNNDTGEYIFEQNGQTTPLEVYDKSGTNDRALWTFKLPDGRLVTPHKYGIQLAIESTKEPELQSIYPEFDIISGGKMVDFSKILEKIKSVKSIVKPPKFKSELDWSPKSWFSYRHDGKFTENDAQILKHHVPEYLKIERDAKLNGTWLKNPDGSDFIGDGREWVMLNSKNGQKLNHDYFYNGVRGEKPFNPEYNDEIWGSDKQSIAATYSNRKNQHSEVNKLYYPKSARVSKINAGHKHWGDIDYKGSRTTTDIAKDDLVDKGADVVKIEDVLDLGPENTLPIVQNGFEYGTDYILKDGLVRKSILGNNGDLDFGNKNIYKALLPLFIGTKLSQEKHNSGKDIHIKKANVGKFTEAANKHNMGVQEFANKVLNAPKRKHSSTLCKRANFARNFAH